MNDIEKANIRKAFGDWAEQSIELEAYPMMLIGQTGNQDGRELRLWMGGDYTTHQVATVLETMAEQLRAGYRPEQVLKVSQKEGGG